MADILGGLVTAGINYGMMQKQFSNQMKLQQNAQNYNTLMWNQSNEYNTPANQMARFQAAGLNPNLIYGQMNQSASAPSSGIGSASSGQAPAISMLEAAQIGLLQAQKDNIESQTDLNRQGIVESGARIGNIEQQIKESVNRVELIGAQYVQTLAQAGKTQQEIRTECYRTTEQAVNAFWADKKNKTLIDNLIADTGLKEDQAKSLLINAWAYQALASSQAGYYDSLKAGQDFMNKYTLPAELKGIKLKNGLTAQEFILNSPNVDWIRSHKDEAQTLAGINAYTACIQGVADNFETITRGAKNVDDMIVNHKNAKTNRMNAKNNSNRLNFDMDRWDFQKAKLGWKLAKGAAKFMF